jgi:hypothetical protein
LVFDGRFVMIWHIQRADVPRESVTWREVLDPSRYEFWFKRSKYSKVFLKINEDAKWNRALSNLTWRLWRRRAWERKNGMAAGF